MTFRQLLDELAEKFKNFEEARFEARQLVQEALRLQAADLLNRENETVPEKDLQRVRQWSEARRRGFPLAYLSGRKGFYKSVFRVTEGVLIPRPETEILVEAVLKRAGAVENFADFGCGSGCIGLSLLLEWPNARLTALDASQVACEITRINAIHLGVEKRARILNVAIDKNGAIMADTDGEIKSNSFDAVVANPPYIAEGDPQVQKSVHDFEPHAALYSGRDGLDALRSWSQCAFALLKTDGVFACEIGAGQSESAQEIMTKIGFQDIESHKDLAGIVRCLTAKKAKAKHG